MGLSEVNEVLVRIVKFIFSMDFYGLKQRSSGINFVIFFLKINLVLFCK